MTHVLAAVDDTGAESVLATATLIAGSLDATLRVVHGQPWSAGVQEHAAERGIELELLSGPTDAALLEAADDPDLALVVVALPRTAGQVPGELVHALAGRLRVPLVLVPAHAPLHRPPRRILFPVDGTRRVSAAARPVIATYVAAGFEVQALLVYDPTTVPSFHDGPEDEQVWRDEFVAEHFAELEVRLSTRPGPLVPALLALAAQHSSDIIALPARPDTSESETSILRQVLESADRPIALVPLPARNGPRDAAQVGAGDVGVAGP